MGAIVNVTDDTFEADVLRCELPTVVDFWAEWCGPCKMLSPILKELAKDLHGKVRFAKIDVDSNPVVARQFGIQSIPTLIYFKGGSAVDEKKGVASKEALKASMEKLFRAS